MLERVAVDLGRRCEHEARLLRHRQAERVVGAERADLQRLNRQLEVVDRARGTRPVQDEVHGSVDVDVAGDVVADEFEVAAAEVGEVGEVAREQVVDADDGMAAIEERFAEVRSDESGGAGDDGSHECNYGCRLVVVVGVWRRFTRAERVRERP